ncbi:MAG: hypothetical protein ACYDH6_08905 [Acidimicrobiales bacterium]
MTAYHRRGPLSAYEEDHLIALEIGGDPTSPSNLWPEPREGAPEASAGATADDKDRLENAAHAAVCSGRMTLRDAQTAMATDWEALGHQV